MLAYEPFLRKYKGIYNTAFFLNDSVYFKWVLPFTQDKQTLPNEKAAEYIKPHTEACAEIVQEMAKVMAWKRRTCNRLSNPSNVLEIFPRSSGKPSLNFEQMPDKDIQILQLARKDPEYLLYCKRLLLGTML